MRIFLALTITLAMLAMLKGQELQTDSLQTAQDSLIVGKDTEEQEKLPAAWSVYFEYLPEYAPHPDQYGWNQQFGVGGSLRHLHVGFFINYIRDGISKPLIFPNQFDLIFLHSGGFIGTSLYNKNQLNVVLKYNLSHGTLVWENTETKADLIREYFFMSKPEVTIQYALIKVLSAFASLGYKISHEADIPGIEKNDFNGFAAGAGIRFGFFQSKP